MSFPKNVYKKKKQYTHKFPPPRPPRPAVDPTAAAARPRSKGRRERCPPGGQSLASKPSWRRQKHSRHGNDCHIAVGRSIFDGKIHYYQMLGFMFQHQHLVNEHNYGTSLCSMRKSTIPIVIFNSYVTFVTRGQTFLAPKTSGKKTGKPGISEGKLDRNRYLSYLSLGST